MHIPEPLIIYLKGAAMGAADIVPGVSGGTIAFISGIYERLINALKSISPRALVILFKQGPKSFWSHIDGNFLACLMAGIFSSFILLANIISHLLEDHPLLVWSFFFGLVLASAFHVSKEINFKCPISIVFGVAGCLIALFISLSGTVQLAPSYPNLFFAGAIAICAMILPGISGSFILLLMGLYTDIIASIKGFDVVNILFFGSGCALGLLSFVHVLAWLLKKYRSMVIALLTGFLIGSLNMLWPWKEAVSFIEKKGKLVPLEKRNISPETFQQLTGGDAQLFLCILIAAFGFFIVWFLERLSND